MNLKHNIEKITQNAGITIADKNIYGLQKFINNLHIKPSYVKDFSSMVDKIETQYTTKSIRMEEYFIKNVVNIYNTKTNKPLYDRTKIDIAKNYNKEINNEVYEELSSMSKDYITAQNMFLYQNEPWKLAMYENKMIELSNSLYMYSHNNSTSFIDKVHAKYGFKKLAKIKYLDYKNQNKTPVMLTFTLDKHFRKYAQYKKYHGTTNLGEDTGLKEINKNANLEQMIEKSYNQLNKTFRDFYEYFKTNHKRSAEKEKFDFILVFEPHKSLTLHLHLLCYVNDNQYKSLEDAWNNYLKDLTPKQKMGQDFKVIDTSIANASTYLSKYLIKEYNTDIDDISFFNMYRSYFSKFKLFRTSNFYHTTQKKIDLMYQYLCKNYPDVIDLIKSQTVPMYEILESMEQKGLFTFQYEKIASISFDRKAIKEFYDTYSNDPLLDEYEIKEEIIQNIDYFTKPITLSRVKMAAFTNDFELLKEILDSYGIDTENLINIDESPQSEIFYEVGMCEMKELELFEALRFAD